MMTSNRPLEDWGKLIGDVPSATAILDRFLHHAEIITITGTSYRLRGKAATATSRPSADRMRRREAPKPAIPPTGSVARNAGKANRRARHKPSTHQQSLANRTAINEDQDNQIPAASFRPPLAAFNPPADNRRCPRPQESN